MENQPTFVLLYQRESEKEIQKYVSSSDVNAFLEQWRQVKEEQSNELISNLSVEVWKNDEHIASPKWLHESEEFMKITLNKYFGEPF
ncbi:hypothetical protein CN918_31725 [Priestia megaterium]|nr:hypothetical protein CN918_31725 [Priestia megaterium]